MSRARKMTISNLGPRQPPQAPLVAEAQELADLIVANYDPAHPSGFEGKDLHLLSRAIQALARQLEQAEQVRAKVPLLVAQKMDAERALDQAEREKDEAQNREDAALRANTNLIIRLGLAIKYLTPKAHEMYLNEPQVRALSEQNTKPSGEVGEEA